MFFIAYSQDGILNNMTDSTLKKQLYIYNSTNVIPRKVCPPIRLRIGNYYLEFHFEYNADFEIIICILNNH